MRNRAERLQCHGNMQQQHPLCQSVWPTWRCPSLQKRGGSAPGAVSPCLQEQERGNCFSLPPPRVGRGSGAGGSGARSASSLKAPSPAAKGTSEAVPQLELEWLELCISCWPAAAQAEGAAAVGAASQQGHYRLQLQPAGSGSAWGAAWLSRQGWKWAIRQIEPACSACWLAAWSARPCLVSFSLLTHSGAPRHMAATKLLPVLLLACSCLADATLAGQLPAANATVETADAVDAGSGR